MIFCGTTRFSCNVYYCFHWLKHTFTRASYACPSFLWCRVFIEISWILLLCYRVLRGQVWSGSDAKCNFAPINANVIDTVHNMLLSKLTFDAMMQFQFASQFPNPLLKQITKDKVRPNCFILFRIIIKWCSNKCTL